MTLTFDLYNSHLPFQLLVFRVISTPNLKLWLPDFQ